MNTGRGREAARRLWGLLRPHRALLLLALACHPIVAALHLAQPYLTKVAVDTHLLPGRAAGFGALVATYSVVVLLEWLGRSLLHELTQRLGRRVGRGLAAALLRRLHSVDLAVLEATPPGELLGRFTTDVEATGDLVGAGALPLLGDLLTIGGILAIMLVLDPTLTVAALAIAPPLGAALVFGRGPARRAFGEASERMSKLSGALGELLGGIEIVQAFGQEARAEHELGRAADACDRAERRAIRFEAALGTLLEVMATLATAGLLFFGGSRFVGGQVELGVLLAFVGYLRRLFAPLAELSRRTSIVGAGLAALERCGALLDERPSIVAPPSPEPLPAPITEISLRGARFAYRADAPVLRGLDLTVPRGEQLAIVGQSGAGKTTLARLLFRFHDPTEGSVALDGVDLRSLDPGALRARLGWVLQEPFLFDASLRENLTLGRPEADARLLDALDRTGARALVDRLGGLDAGVGERGARLSAGERQLVAITRTLLLDPEILVLDEATSALDPESEDRVQRGLGELAQGRTVLVIAHRLSTARRADRIAVLVGGRIVEEGAHTELLRRGGAYAALIELELGPRTLTPPRRAAGDIRDE